MKCTAKTKSGRKCRGTAIAGLDKCRMHCGQKTSVAREKGQQNIARDKIGALLASLGHDAHEDPLEGLMREVGRSAMAVQVLGSMVAELDAPGAKDAKDAKDSVDSVDSQDSEATVYGPNHLGDGAPHILVTMWNEERDRHARYCKLAIDAGIAERQVRVAEAQARMLAGVISAVLDDRELKLSGRQKEIGKKVAARHLRSLPA